MSGGNQSIEDLIASTERGILVTRFWYIRGVDPRTVLYTGLTRDGTFLIEHGKVTKPVKNFRFNESPVIMLNNIEELGKPVRVIAAPLDVRQDHRADGCGDQQCAGADVHARHEFLL